MLLGKKKITRQLIRMLDGSRHSGFNVFAGERTCLCVARRQVQPREKRSLENPCLPAGGRLSHWGHLLPKTNEISARAGYGRLPLQGWQRAENLRRPGMAGRFCPAMCRKEENRRSATMAPTSTRYAADCANGKKWTRSPPCWTPKSIPKPSGATGPG